jgi:hypothetical protein
MDTIMGAKLTKQDKNERINKRVISLLHDLLPAGYTVGYVGSEYRTAQNDTVDDRSWCIFRSPVAGKDFAPGTTALGHYPTHKRRKLFKEFKAIQFALGL